MPDEYGKTGCADLPCQCGKCKSYTRGCCFDRPICCPNDPYYNPRYKCPDFIQREEASENAT